MLTAKDDEQKQDKILVEVEKRPVAQKCFQKQKFFLERQRKIIEEL